MIEARLLHKAFWQGQTEIPAVNQVSLSISQGEKVAIVGPSGSGKTTLLSLLTGLEAPDRGQVLIANQDLSQMSENQLSHFRGQNLGIVFQQFYLMPHLSALDNVALPLDIQGHANSENLAKQALESVGLSNRLSHRPNQMSGGECQRVAIARATVMKPKVLFADEPSGNLDTETGERITQMLFDLVKSEGMTLVLVTHNPQLATLCDRQLTIRGGQLQ